MKKKVVILLGMLLAASLLLSACGSAPDPGTAAAQQTETGTSAPAVDEYGLYTWTVGNGHIVRTKTDVMKYIVNGSWKSKDMARDLGFGDWKEAMEVALPTGFKRIRDGREVMIRYDYPNNTVINLLFFIDDHDRDPSILMGGFEPTEYYYVEDSTTRRIPFDLIVCFAYACEHYAAGERDPFDGILSYSSATDYVLN